MPQRTVSPGLVEDTVRDISGVAVLGKVFFPPVNPAVQENVICVGDREERKLLLDPSSTPTKALNGAEPNYHSLPSARTDEQALLSSILAKTASNIIDVSAADSQGMEQHEYMDRARQYSTRLAVLSSSLTHWKKLPPLPSLTSQPHQVLASEPIPFSDLQQVSRIAAYAYSALSQIRVDAKEELVVQFGIP